jgi:hypothetical protein
MKATLINFFIKNYKFFFHIAGNVILFAIFWAIFLRNTPDSELLGWIAVTLPFSCYANIDALKSSGIDQIFQEAREKRGL